MATAEIVDGKVKVTKEVTDDPVATKVAVKKQKLIRLMINPQDGPDGKYDVTLGVNGKVILIQRGKEVEIPEDYYSVLKDARIDQLIRNPGEEEQIISIARYSYNVLGEREVA
jgi:hypothetical protein